MKKIAILTLLTFALIGCDKVQKPLKDDYGFVELPKTNKTVLIEEFTGTSCTFCPDGARKIEGYLKSSPDNVVAVAIHASGFAIPQPTKGRPYNFQTDEAKDFYAFMGSGGLPGGMFDRAGYPDDVFRNPADWDKLLQQRLALTADFTLSGSLEYNPADSTFSLKANVLALSDLPAMPINLVAYLVEDSIVAPQLDHNVTYPDYVHNHVFRTSFAGMTGEEISAGAITTDQIFNTKYTLKRSKTNGNEWDLDQCSAVFFVYNRTTQEVLQAHHVHLE